MFTAFKNLDTKWQDQTTPVRVLRFARALGELTIANNTAIGAQAVTVVDATGVQAGHLLCFMQGARQFQTRVLSISGAPTLTFDTPLDYAFTTAADLHYATMTMNVDGSSSPVTFAVAAAPECLIDVVQVRILITDNADMDDSKFGGITALTKGIVLQYVSPSATYALGNAKTNGDLRLLCTGEYASKAPAGNYAFSAACHLGGQENAGVVVRLNGANGDQIQIIVQDNLTTLTGVYALTIGHVVD